MQTIIVNTHFNLPKNYTGLVIQYNGGDDIHIYYVKNEKLHRSDGQPAVIHSTAERESYWLNGKKVNERIAATYSDFFPEEKNIDYSIETNRNKIEDVRHFYYGASSIDVLHMAQKLYNEYYEYWK